MHRGTTPTLSFSTPYEAAQILGGFVTFAQRGSVAIEKAIGGDSVQVDDNRVSVELTQNETLGLSTGIPCKCQLRIILANGKRAASDVVEIPVEAILKDGEI